MYGVELSLAVFGICSALRIAAYVPQLMMVALHPQGAVGFSYSTWALFSAANASTAFYAGGTLGDMPLALVNTVSAICSVGLMGLAAWRRWRSAAATLVGAAQRSGKPAA